MTTPTFPTLSDNMDSSKYSIELEDNTMSDALEGGYTVTRARTTRRLRLTFKGGYTNITDTDKGLLMAFLNTTSVGALIFNWTNTEDGITYMVRFKGVPAFKYVGRLNYRRWDCDFVLQQA